jgi:hypothetical protein
VYCGFPVINFCNPAVHYKTSCIFSASQQPKSGPDRLLLRFLDHTLLDTHEYHWDSSVPVISSSHRSLPHSTQKTQETNIYVLGQTRTRGPSNQAAAELRLSPLDHRDRCLIKQSHFFLQNTAEYCRILQNTAEYYRILQNTEEYCRILQSTTEYYRILQNCKILQNTAE